ncbi:MAG: hypothetical protein EZS28_043658 [Streblomastix strix]|uniref:Uncharacterized protein n=1 Tax=Streblomastix strix TaxID=222440 RepID=A0A5J4TTX2_9EUKA|nr:MAG: hypothetical protein EZS28_043658 [Streblomastix strix]
MNSYQQMIIEQEIRRIDPQLSPYEALIGTFALTDSKARRNMYGQGFPNSLLQHFYETNIIVNNEGKLVETKQMENTWRFEQNINVRLVEPSMNLGSRSPVVTQEEQLNEMLNFGSLQQKVKESKQLEKDYPTDNQEDLPNSAIYPDIPAEQTIDQENFSDRDRQQIQYAILQDDNLITVYEI